MKVPSTINIAAARIILRAIQVLHNHDFTLLETHLLGSDLENTEEVMTNLQASCGGDLISFVFGDPQEEPWITVTLRHPQQKNFVELGLKLTDAEGKDLRLYIASVAIQSHVTGFPLWAKFFNGQHQVGVTDRSDKLEPVDLLVMQILTAHLDRAKFVSRGSAEAVLAATPKMSEAATPEWYTGLVKKNVEIWNEGANPFVRHPEAQERAEAFQDEALRQSGLNQQAFLNLPSLDLDKKD